MLSLTKNGIQLEMSPNQLNEIKMMRGKDKERRVIKT
jgi:hypothetical protein